GDTVRVSTDEDARAAASSGFDDGNALLAPESPEPPPASAPEPVRAQEAAAALRPQDAAPPRPAETPAAAEPVTAPAAPKTVMHCAGAECGEQPVIAALSKQAPAARLRRTADCAAGPFIARLNALGAQGEERIRALRASVALVLEALKDAEVCAPALDDGRFSVDGKEVQVVSRISGSKAKEDGVVRLDLQWSLNQDGVESEDSALLYIKPDGTVYGQASAAIEDCLTRDGSKIYNRH
ncbi:MAG: hypothetical protein HY928_12895, partial [Elusimicrobia bacterium]|nr:hypothetical protein [Elusimicrobiota bacterium]